jgi:hypothetical protein
MPAKERVPCGAPLRDGTLCQGAGLEAWGNRCEHHGAEILGAELGWRVRGSRKVGVYVAQRGSDVLVADTAAQLFAKIRQGDEPGPEAVA